MNKRMRFLILSLFVISLFICVLSHAVSAAEQTRNILLIIAKTGDGNFGIWRKEFIKAGGGYYSGFSPDVLKKLNIEKSVSVLDIDTTTGKDREFVEVFQRALGLSKDEPFIGFIEVGWVKDKDGNWGPGKLGASRIIVKLPSDRPGYMIASGKGGNIAPETISKIAGEDFRHLLRELDFKMKSE
ncbi:MAG: hypothetical protein M1269_05845 [Chloroflexi bacterium]|nr:hypothetical protein [Chloroflexota bacterium]